MNIAVIGLGSMGKRRIRLLKEMYPLYRITGVDGREDRREEAKKIYGIDVISDLNLLPLDIKCAFVCTSPLSHAAIIKECLDKGWHVFSELNLVPDKYADNLELAKNKNCILFLSSTFFYREEIKYIRSCVTENKKWNYIYHIGQYLPDWHPWEPFCDFFIGDKRTNGCREIMAIELPWVIKTFGQVVEYHVMSGKMSGLKIDFDDTYMVQLLHESGNRGVLVVDVVSPVAVRKLEIYSEGKYISWNGTPDTVMEFNYDKKVLEKVEFTEKAEHIEGYGGFIIENAYRNEIREFFDVISTKKEPLYGFMQDKEILQLIDSLGA